MQAPVALVALFDSKRVYISGSEGKETEQDVDGNGQRCYCCAKMRSGVPAAHAAAAALSQRLPGILPCYEVIR